MLVVQTSFILSLRNYLDACTWKDATCYDPKYGGDKKSLLLQFRRENRNITREQELIRQEVCACVCACVRVCAGVFRLEWC